MPPSITYLLIGMVSMAIGALCGVAMTALLEVIIFAVLFGRIFIEVMKQAEDV